MPKLWLESVDVSSLNTSPFSKADKEFCLGDTVLLLNAPFLGRTGIISCIGDTQISVGLLDTDKEVHLYII